MCDTLCVLGEHGLLFAKNSDRPPGEAQVVESLPRRAAGGVLRTQHLELPDRGAAAILGSRPTWLWGLEHGVNEHGVAIGNEKIWTTGRPRSRPPALLGMDLVRLGLERATTADDAMAIMTALIEEYGQGGSGEEDHDEPYDSSFLIADARSAWVLETCDRTWVARPTSTGAAVSNRVSLSRDWTRSSPDVSPDADFQAWRHPNVPTSIADHRLKVTQARVDHGPSLLEPAAVISTLRSHGPATSQAVPTEPGPDNQSVTVCMHVRGMQATTASMVCTVETAGSEIRAWVALGSPCASIYVPVFPEAGVPAELGEAKTWHRFAILRDRVEADPDALASVQSRLAPVERELWERSDAAGSDPTARARWAQTAFAPVELALRSLDA